MSPLINNTAKDILGKKPLPARISGEEGHKGMKVLEGIYRAAASGNKVLL